MRSYAPRHRVIVKDLKTGEVKFDVSDDLLSVATNKAYGRCAGTWQMMLTYTERHGDRYDRLISVNDIVTIELDAGAGKGFEPVMTGHVDRASRVFEASGNRPSRSVKVSGQDRGKFLTRDMGWDISGAQAQDVQEQGGGIQTVAANYLSRVSLQAGTPAQLIEQLLGIFTGTINTSTGGKYVFNPTTDDDWQIWDSSLQYIRDTSVWAAMERYAHRPWNMLHTETVDLSTFQVILERNPINDQGMLDRPAERTHRITDEDICYEDIGVCDSERTNLLCYWPTMYKVSPQAAIDIVMADPDLTVFDKDEIDLHGYCPQVIEDNFNPVGVRSANDEGAAGILLPEATKRAATFWNWYSMNHELESGTFVIHGNPSIKAGDVLLVRQGESAIWYEYLIEQVAHSHWIHPAPKQTTTLHVTRGQARA